MLSSLSTKLALRKVGLSSKDLDFSTFTNPSSTSSRDAQHNTQDADASSENNGWTSWMSVKSLPLTVHPWLSPPPAAIDVARRVPRIGDQAPLDRSGKLVFAKRRRVIVVFLRCVGCAFAQKTFLNLRTLANRYSGFINCIAVSHSSALATRKWIDLLGGAWSVQVVIDEERAIYAAWGLGVAGSLWYVLNPTTQMQGWKETGWLGEKVAGAIQNGNGRVARERNNEKNAKAKAREELEKGSRGGVQKGLEEEEEEVDDYDGPSTEMGSKWQETGAFAIDGSGTVIWGGKAARADELMDLEEGAKLLML